MFDRAYRTLRELQKQAAEPRKQKAEPEPPEPPKPNGGIRIATAPEGAQPSEPETKNKETNPSPTPVAHALLRAVSRLFATPLAPSIASVSPKLQRFAQFPFKAATVKLSRLGSDVHVQAATSLAESA